jgi:predicted NBD/HSP70 family sugar kinase
VSDAEQVLVVDIGSTFTKAALVDVATGQVCSRGDALTSRSTDVMDAVRELATRLGAGPEVEIVGCSSAGGGLRLAVIGYERAVTADAGFRVGLSAGAKVVHVACGPLDDAALTALAADRPDIILLVGGTDGGNADVIRHNAALLARAPLPPSVPIVVAGNSAAQADCVARLRAGGRSVITADNVLPEIGVIAPDSARAAMREAFLTHVIGGKGLSRDPAFPSLVRMATPDAVLRLDDGNEHPITKLVRALSDLEAWHASQGHVDAVLEARLVRVERLHSAFSQTADRESMVAYLEKQILPQHKGREWWTRGQALLAQFVRRMAVCSVARWCCRLNRPITSCRAC